jgi:hypothetical protein
MKLLTTSLLTLLGTAVLAQEKDTLRNHSNEETLVAYKHIKWGYQLGHNGKYEQQYAEKYTIPGAARILGVISHHAGSYSNPHNKVAFNILASSTDKYPGTLLGSKEVAYSALDLSGSAMTTMFDEPITVSDSFFVAFDLFDYAHGGYEGDTIGLFSSPDGSRISNATLDRGRNVVQIHNHSEVAWRDYATQNFTPADRDMIHFALYPILEWGAATSLPWKQQGLTLLPPYPNPASDKITIEFRLEENSPVSIELLEINGKPLQSLDRGYLSAGHYQEQIFLNDLQRGNYIYLIRSEIGTIAGKFSVL